MGTITLDLKDRLILANQRKIPEKLYPDEQAEYARNREVFEKGLEIEYHTCFWSLREEPVSHAVSEEVYEILQM